MQIFVKLVGDKTITVCNIDQSSTIGDIKAAIQAKEGIPLDVQFLVYGMKHLKNDFTLREYGIHSEATIHLLDRLRGGNLLQSVKMAMKEEGYEVSDEVIAEAIEKCPGASDVDSIKIKMWCHPNAHNNMRPIEFGGRSAKKPKKKIGGGTSGKKSGGLSNGKALIDLVDIDDEDEGMNLPAKGDGNGEWFSCHFVYY